MIVIDAGHGGTDNGGGSNEYWLEKDLALKISNYQFNRFKELGIPVKMTRYTDTYLSPRERVEIARNAYGATSNVILLSNHINSSASGFDGAEVIYSINNSPDFANKIAADLKEAGQNINRVYTRRNSAGNDFYFIIRGTRPMNSVIVEYGFANSPGDDIVQLRDQWEQLAEAVVKATAEYLGYPYTPPKQINYYLYTVKSGDSLYKIAQKTSTSVNEIKKLNNLNSNDISIDQILKIPNKERSIYYTKANDTIYQIIKNLGIKTEDLLAYNDLFNLELLPNQTIKIMF